DNAGLSDPNPPTRTITVTPAGLTASFTSPAAGATVAGIQPVGMAVTNASGASNTFTLAIDGTQVFTQTVTTTSTGFNWDTRSYGNGPHTLGLTVRDSTGATASATRSVTVNNNATGQITVSFPLSTPGQDVTGVQTVRIQASNTAGATNRFEISVDGVIKDLVITGLTTIDWNWNTMGLTNGSHTISVTVNDSTGRTGTGSNFFDVMNSLSAAVTSPAPGATVSGTAWVVMWVSGTTGTSNTFTLSAAGQTVGTATTSSTGPVSIPWDTTKTPNGAQTLVAQVYDATNNGGQMTVPVTVSNASGPPAASFTSPAAGATVSGTVAIGLKATGGTAPFTYRLTIDGTQVLSTSTTATTASFAWNTTTYDNGGHMLALTVTDKNGGTTSASRIVNSQNTSAATLAASFTAPASNATVSGTVTVGMAASGGTAPYTYKLTIDGTQVFTTSTSATSASFAWNTTTATNAAHTLSLAITDGKAASSTATLTVTVQNGTALAASFTSPTAGATVSGTVSVGLAASGGTAPYTYTLTIDGAQAFTTSTSATSASFAWNTTTATNAAHTLGLTVTDSAAHSATATRSVTVSNTGGTLQVAITQPTSGSTVSGTNWVVLWLSGSSGTSNTYTLTVGAQTVATTTTSGTGPVSIPWDTTSVANGTQTLTASARDATGNTGSSSVSIVVQNSGPSASFTSPAAGATVSGTTTVGMAATGGAAPYTYKLTIDGTQVFTTTTSATTASFAWNTTTYASGAHTLGLTVTDSAAASGTSTRSVTVQNGSTLAASFTAPAAGATVSGAAVTVGVTASGGTPGYTYTVTVDGAQVFTTSTTATSASFAWNTTTVANGSHTLGLAVTDAHGAAATATRTVTVSNATTTFQVFITTPSAGQTVSGTTWVTIWTSGAAAGTNTYTMTVGSTTVWTDSASGNPVTLPWVTSQTPNGTQTLVVTVRDGTGATGTASVTVTVLN
ncbi:MAG TPA: Ig-like domain-containing protein, partial [Methylomirabilota bacterium]|nr:Ig-like domain-containing protein [Methylomirabilota bacterium]